MRFKLFKPTADGDTLQRVITSPPVKIAASESGSVRVKANGAIVVNRPCVSSISSDDDDDDYDEYHEDRAMFFESGSPTSLTTMGDLSQGSRENASAQLVLEQENQYLRHLLRREHEQAQAWHRERNKMIEKLTMSRQEIKFIHDAVSHQSLASPAYLTRRRSTGGDHDDAAIASRFCHRPSKYYLTHEQKLHILLAEVEAMQQEEYRLVAKNERLSHGQRELEQQINERDETIRQLRHDLRYQQMLQQLRKEI